MLQLRNKQRNKRPNRNRPRQRRNDESNINDQLFGRGERYLPTIAPGWTVAGVQLRDIPLARTPHLQRGQLYHESALALHSTLGAPAYYYFRSNDAYDPNATGVGHQPIGFDQMMLLYEQFYVLRSSIRVKLAEANSKNVIVGVCQTPDQTNIATAELQENGLVKSTLINAYYGPKGTTEIRMSCDNAKYYGMTHKLYIANPNFQGTAAASPTEMNYWCIFAYPLNGTDTPMDVTFEVTLAYDIFYQEPRKLVQS